MFCTTGTGIGGCCGSCSPQAGTTAGMFDAAGGCGDAALASVSSLFAGVIGTSRLMFAS